MMLDRTVAGPNGCIVYIGARSNGYGKPAAGYAHRIAYQDAYGPIPDGHEIDHLCCNRACVNVTHLEAVTATENKRRVGQRRTHCPQGHPYSVENTAQYATTRICKTCRTQRNRKRSEGETP